MPRERLSHDSEGTAITMRPKYQRVRDHFYTEIRSGRLVPGQSLPTEVELVESFGMSRYTVRQALAELENEGIIRRTPGRGTVVTTTQERESLAQLDMFALIAPELRGGFYPSLVHGFEHATSEFQHQVLVSNSSNDTGRQGDLILQMIDRSVGGVALVPTTAAPTPAYQIRQLQKHHIPVVFCHRSVEGISAPCVTWSGYEVGCMAGAAFCSRGHRRVATLIAHHSPLADEYTRGLRESLTANESHKQGELAVVEYGVAGEGEHARDVIRRALTKALSADQRPTALFCGHIGHAEQIYLQAEELGLKLPRDLSLIAFGGAWRGDGLAERISCVAVDEFAVGSRAAQLLREMRAGKRPLESDEQFVFPVSMLPGDTLGPAPES